MRAPDPAPDGPALPAETPRGGRPSTAQVRFDELERGVRGLIHDLAAARADLADREQAERRRQDASLLSLVEVLDAFERVLAEAPEDPDAGPGAAPAWAGNVRTVYRLLSNAVRAQGATAMEPATGEFDPHRQTALETAYDQDAAPGTIVGQLYRGYVVGDRVLRKPGVVVAGPAPGGADRG